MAFLETSNGIPLLVPPPCRVCTYTTATRPLGGTWRERFCFLLPVGPVCPPAYQSHRKLVETSALWFVVAARVPWFALFTPPDKDFFLGDMGTCLTKKTRGGLRLVDISRTQSGLFVLGAPHLGNG